MDELPDNGTVRPITRWGESVMHRVLEPVTTFDDGLATLVADMIATMYAADGVGLAANQIGVDQAVFVFDCPDDDHERHRGVVCNPRLVLPDLKDRNLDDGDEGCLSFPGAFVSCPRPDWARVEGQDHAGAPIVHEGNGLLARCLQHETDHLFGTVFADRLSTKARKKLRREQEEATEEFPPGWPVGEEPERSAGEHV